MFSEDLVSFKDQSHRPQLTCEQLPPFPLMNYIKSEYCMVFILSAQRINNLLRTSVDLGQDLICSKLVTLL